MAKRRARAWATVGIAISAFTLCGTPPRAFAIAPSAIRSLHRGGHNKLFRGSGKGRLVAALLGAAAALLADASFASEQPQKTSTVPLAVVTDVTGKAVLTHTGRRRGVLPLDLLDAFDELQLFEKAQVEIAFFSGAPRVFLLRGPGRFAVHPDAVVSGDAAARIVVRDLAAAWRTVQIRPGLVGRASVALRGSLVEALQVQAPVGPQLEEALNTLRWKPPYGRDSQNWQYTVRLIDANGSVVFSASTRDTELALPAQLPWLREQPYLWTVKAISDDGRRAEAATEFVLVDRATQERMQLLTQIAHQVQADHSDADGTAEQVLLALALEQAGLRSQADRQWRALAAVRPAFASFAATPSNKP